MTEKYRFIDHTADIRMEVFGRDLRELFVHAALGFTEAVSGQAEPTGSVVFSLNIEADGVEELLIDWLRELLFRKETQGFIFREAHIHELTERLITAEVIGGVADPDIYPEMEIKAVTYHGLKVEKTDSGYRAAIVFDI
jgi:SHS2 domain-containing protein